MANLRVATYCRISDDRGGQGLGVERQREDCERLVEQRGWTLAGRYVDNDLSAYSGRPRPDYLRLLDAIRAGLVDAVVAWHPDRLHRSPSELEEFLTVVEKHSTTVETCRAGAWDLSSPSGRMTARILGSVARGESEHKSDRVRRALEQRATMGTSHGRIPYGWTRTVLPDGTKVETVNEPQAELVRSLAHRIVAGESLRSIVTDLNTRGIPSPTGREWGKTMLRAIVTRERNVGLRVHRGEVVGMGTWPPILDRPLWDQVQAVLSDPSRRTSSGSAAVHLLSGIARCGVCDGLIRASMNRTVPSYKCADASCVSRNRRDVDAFVVDLVLSLLQRGDVVDLLTPPDGTAREAAAEVSQLRARLDLAADSYAEGEIDAQQLHRITERLRPRIEAAQSRARVVDDAPLLDGLVGAPDARAVWDGLPLSRRRGVIDLLMSVRILKTSQGARAFDPDSVEITWKWKQP